MTAACPPIDQLERLLAGRLSAAQEQDLESHVAGCADCQLRLEHLTESRWTLPGRGTDSPNTPPPPAALGRLAHLPAAQIRHLERCLEPERERESDRSTPPPAPADDLVKTAFWSESAEGGGEPKPAPDPASPDAEPDLPAAFGRYRVCRAVGSGGFGKVYLGHDDQLDRPVAIKVFRGGPGAAPPGDRAFLEEARRLARLRHPNVVAVHDAGVHEGQAYLVSDFLEGPNLGEWLEGNRPGWPEATRLAAALADALAHAHARLIVHRDVKPANVLLTADRTPVLVDFGIALDEARAGGHEKGLVSGTPHYMSPEQFAGTAHRIDGRTDVYSLGVMLYEMLTGLVPFRAGELGELLRQVRDDEPQPPRQLAPDLPAELERVCLKAMAKRQQDRYSTAADFAADLRRAAQAAEAAGLPAPAGERPRTAPTPAPHRRVRTAERRQVTVLVCGSGLFGSEAFLRDLDPEDQARALRDFRQTCEPAVRRFDGAVVQCDDKGLFVCFGFPVAYEDAALRAARAALTILDDLKSFGDVSPQGRRLELRPWVGLHTGQAVVEAGETTVSLVGEARMVAARLEDVAEPGRVVCTEAAHQLLRGQFASARLGSRKLKGVSQSVELFRLLPAAEAGGRLDAARDDGLTPLTGRDHEVSLLKDRWERAQQGEGHVVFLVGDPGLGKSRLLHTLKEHVQGPTHDGEVDAAVIEWRCAPHYLHTGFYPAIEFYERALGFGREESPAERFGRMLQRLEQYDLARPETVPLWAALLSLPAPDRFPPPALSPARQREETFRILVEWLHVRAARRPVLFVVEDLHWADATTLEFLGQFLAEGLNDRTLIVFTFRPEFQAPWPAAPHQTVLTLNNLTRTQVGELMRGKTGDPELPEALVEQVYERSGGVPLFVEEFTRVAQESGALDRAKEDGGRAPALLAREIPATLQDLLMARLDRHAGDREVAQLAATLGREFSYELLAAVAPLGEPALQAELARLVQADVLYFRGPASRRHYLFKHALLQDAAYNSLVKGKRQQFHRRTAEVLEAKFPQTAGVRPELLAHHYTEAGLTEPAVGYWLRAGLRSRERSAEHEAIAHLSKGLELLETLPESPGRDALEVQLLAPLGTACIAERGYASPEVGPIFRRARALSERIGEPTTSFAFLWGTFAWHVVRGDFRLCADLAGEAASFADRAGDPGMRMEALFLQGLTLFYRGDFAGARDHCTRGLADDDRERTLFWASHTGEHAGVTHRCYLALALWHLGHPDRALRVHREALELARAVGQPFSLEYALHHSAWLHQHCRLGAEVRAAGDEEMRVATEQGFIFWRASATLYRAAGLLLQGDLGSGLPLFQKGLDAYRATGAGLALPYYLSILGAAQTQAGRLAEARQALDEGLALAEKNDDRFQEAELHRLQGELLLAEGPDRAAAAEGCFRLAVETARRQQSPAWELRASMSLARLWQRQGRRDDARTALAAVYATFTEGFTTPDLVDAAALLKALEEEPPRPARTAASPRMPPSAGPSKLLTRRRFLLGAGGLAAAAGGWLGYSTWHRGTPGGSAPSGNAIRVGILHSQTGTMRESEVPVQEMTQLTLEDINHRGGLLGRPVEFVIRDGASDERVFAREAARLIRQDRVCAIFGCWTSASRKAVKEVVEERRHLLLYPVQYEGVEASAHIVYTGATPNQQLLPALDWCCARTRGAKFFLAGSDYIFPRTAHAILRHRIEEQGASVVGERYLPLGALDARAVAEAVRRAEPDYILNTINGSSNLGFFSALRDAGVTPQAIPTLSFSVDEQLLQNFDPHMIAGDYAAWAYFAALPGRRNEEFIEHFRARWGRFRVVTGPMESAYLAVRFWAQAVADAGTEDPAAVRAAIGGQSLDAPEGPGVRVDPRNQHTWKYFHLGQITPEGRLRVVASHDAALPPEPYPRYRSPAEWDRFQTELYRRWGNRWSSR